MFINKTPSPEQKEAIKFCLDRRKGLVCYGTGTGKTLIMLIISYLQLKHQDSSGIIIVGTSSALKSIKREMWDTFREKPMSEKHFLQERRGILLINYSEVGHLAPKLKRNNYTLILDEYHKCKSKNTQTTKNCTKLRRKCSKVYGFTATPIMKDIKDLYSLIHWLNPMILGTWEQFCQEYTMFYKIPTNRGFDILKPTRYRNLIKLKRVLEPIMITYFPDYDITYVRKPCELEDVKGYRNAIKEALVPTGDEKRDLALPMLAVREAKKFVAISKPKLIALLKTIREVIKSGVIIYCDEYRVLDPVYKLLTKKNFEVLKYTGKQSDKLNDKNMDKFTEEPENKVLLISRVAGASLNLQATNRLIMLDIPSNIGAFQQLMGRVARKYSTYDSYYIYLMITEETVEDYWYDYITMYSEPLKKLFGNGLVPKGVPSFSEYAKKELIKSRVWEK